MPDTLFDSVSAAIRRQLAALVVFSFLCNLLLLVTSIYTLQLYDRVLSSGSLDTLIWLTAIAMLVIAVYGILEYVRRRLLSRISAWFDTELSTPVIARSIAQRLRRGSVVDNGLADIAEIRGFIGGEAVLAMLDAPWAPGFIAIIWLIHPVLGVVALIGAVVLLACAVLNDQLTRRPQQIAGAEVRRALASAGRYVDNAETVSALGMTGPLLSRWRTVHQSAHASSVSVADTTAALYNLSRAMRLVVQILIMGAGAFLVLRGDITAGAMIAASIVLSRALSPVERSISAWRSYVSFRAGQHNLKALFQDTGPPPSSIALPRPEGQLAATDVSFVPSGGDKPVIRNVSFALQRGEMCAIVGPSGAGKSTLCRLIVGVWPPTEGHVRLDGADVAAWDPDDLGRHIGYLAQQVELFPGSVAENIARMREAEAIDIITAARLADVHEMILRLPQGYDTDVGVHGGRLSGGQRQRIGLARALYGDPALIVLDEPNTALDADGDRALLGTLAHLKKQRRTVVLVTHQPSILRAADRILVLRAGEVSTFGAREDVLKTMPRYQVVVRPGTVHAAQGGGA